MASSRQTRGLRGREVSGLSSSPVNLRCTRRAYPPGAAVEERGAGLMILAASLAPHKGARRIRRILTTTMIKVCYSRRGLRVARGYRPLSTEPEGIDAKTPKILEARCCTTEPPGPSRTFGTRRPVPGGHPSPPACPARRQEDVRSVPQAVLLRVLSEAGRTLPELRPWPPLLRRRLPRRPSKGEPPAGCSPLPADASRPRQPRRPAAAVPPASGGEDDASDFLHPGGAGQGARARDRHVGDRAGEP